MKQRLMMLNLFVFLTSLSFISLATAAETIVYSEGFEANNGGFTLLTSGLSAGWQWGTPAVTPGPGSAHSGSKCWGTNFGSTMPRPADQSIVSPAIKLSQVSADQIIRVRFWAFVSIDGMYDRGQFFVSKDGQNWDSLVQLYNNMETDCGITPRWHKYEFTIDNSYAADPDPNNNIIYLRMRAAVRYASPSFYCAPYVADDLSGVYLDDLAITYYDVPATRKLFSLEAWEDPSAWASCPWVAPWNGSRFEVDNDIYSVARMPENEYRDSYRLSVPLVARDGVYPVEVQERESEDSFTDYVALLEIDHAPDVAVTTDGSGILRSYKPAQLSPPVSAIAKGNNVAALLAIADNKGFAAYNSDTVTVNFGAVDIANGATMVLGVKGFVLGDGISQPYSATPAVVVETMDSGGVWQERGRLLPRFAYSTGAYDLKPFLTSGQEVNVRLRSISHDIKYHLIDYVALFAGEPPGFNASQVSPVKATFGSRDVLGTLLTADGNYVKMSPSDKFTLEFPVLPLATGNIREFVFVSKGYYVPKSGSYLIYTWDGTGWVQRDGHSFNSSDTTRDFDLSLFLPDPTGKYRVRIWQDYQYEYAGIDFVRMMVGGSLAPLLTAFDNKISSNVTTELSSSDNVRDAWNTWQLQCPRDRIVDVEFTPPGPANVPPSTNPVVVTNTGSLTPTITWTYGDADSDPQALSNVQVWTGPGATGIIMWNPPPFAGTGTAALYAGSMLQTGVTYYARVQANDGKDWGAWSETSFAITTQICGDLNGDGKVNSVDYGIFRSALGKQTGQPGYSAAADMDNNGVVSLKDYSTWYACYIKYR